MIDYKRYLALVNECIDLDRMYYTEGVQNVPDYVYDGMRRSILEYERANPGDISIYSPSLRVGEDVIKDLLTVKHHSRLLSIDNVNSTKEASKIVNSWYEKFGDRLIVLIEPKFDGNTGNVRYVDGHFTVAASRGDGDMGRDITAAMRKLVPLTIEAPGTVEIRGEVTFRTNKLKAYNDYRAVCGLDPVANARSAVHAILSGNRFHTDFEYQKYLQFFVFDAYSDQRIFKDKLDDMNEFLKNCGFMPGLKYVVKSKESFDFNLEMAIRNWGKRHLDENNTALDGLVIKIDSNAVCATLGATHTAPKWCIAYKFEPLAGKSRIWKCEFTVGRTGQITPVVYVDPVKIDGVQITKASLANCSKLFKLDIRIGDTVSIYRGGDVIPQIGYVMERPKAAGPAISWPTKCPCCQSDLAEIGAKSFCQNDDCEDKIVAQLRHFFSREAMYLRNVSTETFKKLVSEFKLKNPYDVIALSSEAVMAASERIGVAAANNFISEIREAMEDPTLGIRRFIYGLGVPGIGMVTAGNIGTAVMDIDAFLALEDAEVALSLNIFKFAVESANSLAAYLKKHKEWIAKFIAVIRPVMVHALLPNLNNALVKEKTFVLSGELPELRSTLEARITNFGGVMSDTVNKKTNYVVFGNNPAKKKVKAAAKYKTPQLTYEQLLQVLSNVE